MDCVLRTLHDSSCIRRALRLDLRGHLDRFIVVQWFFVAPNIRINVAAILGVGPFRRGDATWRIQALRICDFAEKRTEFVEAIVFAIDFVGRWRIADSQTNTIYIGFVFLQMSIQIGLLAKAAFAQMAFKRTLFVVNVSHVTL